MYTPLERRVAQLERKLTEVCNALATVPIPEGNEYIPDTFRNFRAWTERVKTAVQKDH